jgi:hypothetical protein
MPKLISGIIVPSAHDVEYLGCGSRHAGKIAGMTTSLWTDSSSPGRAQTPLLDQRRYPRQIGAGEEGFE